MVGEDGACSAISASTCPTSGGGGVLRPADAAARLRAVPDGRRRPRLHAGRGRRGAYLFLYEATEDRAYTRGATGLQHLAFVVPTRGAVRGVHAHVVQAGSTVVHAPQEWPQYPPPYFATFWLDPFGIMLEAVCHHDRD